MAMMLCGCPEERAQTEPFSERPSEIGASSSHAPALAMVIDVLAVRADQPVDLEAVKTVLHDAEPALLSCLDADGSTGVVACKLSIVDNGSVGEVSQQKETTYGSDDARACFERIIASLRFPTPQSHDRIEVTASLEVRTRYESQP